METESLLLILAVTTFKNIYSIFVLRIDVNIRLDIIKMINFIEAKIISTLCRFSLKSLKSQKSSLRDWQKRSTAPAEYNTINENQFRVV